MDCGWGSPEEIAVCIHFIQRWSQVAADLAGVGSFALIAGLIWVFRRLRGDIMRWENELAQERALRGAAESTAKEARHRAELAESIAARATQDKQDLETVLHAGADDMRGRLADAQMRLARITTQIKDVLQWNEGGADKFWSRPVGVRFDDYERRMADSIPILLFGNQKGGVGKSTVVTNLAAAFASRGERVLTIDLDYQGSHSSLAQLQIGAGGSEPESMIDFLFLDDLERNWPALRIRKIPNSFHYIPAFYSFEQIERSGEYQWALGETKDDARYRLARALLSDVVQNSETGYDRILIDAPPRFTLGFVNGICAATHLYVPTVVDSMSTSAVKAFAFQFNRLQPIVNPRIRWAGIIGTMTFANQRDPLMIASTAARAADEAERAAQLELRTKEPLFIRRPVIRRDAALAQATEKGVAYLNEPAVRPMFDELASVIEAKAPSRKTGS